jgi:hypothetical protein
MNAFCSSIGPRRDCRGAGVFRGRAIGRLDPRLQIAHCDIGVHKMLAGDRDIRCLASGAGFECLAPCGELGMLGVDCADLRLELSRARAAIVAATLGDVIGELFL